MFISLLSFGGPLATKCVSLNNAPCIAMPTLIDLNPVERIYYSSVISLDKCNGNCDVFDALSTKYVFPVKEKT